MRYFHYVREFTNKGQMNELDFVQRMLVSAEVTKKITGFQGNAVELIFGFDRTVEQNVYREWNAYREYCDADGEMKQSGLMHYYDYALSHISELHIVKVDLSRIHMSGKNCLLSIAFKLFIIAASQHSVNQDNDWSYINIFNWKNTAKRQKARTIAEIEAFMADQQIYGRLDKAYNLHIFSKKQQEEMRAMKNTVYMQRPA